MTVRLSTDWRYRGFRALVLENRHLRVVILPELGGKIWSILAKAQDREMLWHNPRVPPRAAPYGAAYDNWFCGGWDELFPNDTPVVIDGEPYPDHGEIWALAAEWEVVERSPDAVSIRLIHQGVAIPTTFAKTVTLRDGETKLRVEYEITNHGDRPLDVHWKLHPALPVTPGARLHLPVRRAIIDPDFAAGFLEREFAWPHAEIASGAKLDMRELPAPDAGSTHFYYALELSAGWCGVTYPDERIGFGLEFDPEILPTVWIFGSYGGWRDLAVVILEPCTGYPVRLDEAIAQGTAHTLAPHQTLRTEVAASVFTMRDT